MVSETVMKIIEGSQIDESEMEELPAYLCGEEINDSERAAFLSAIHVRGENLNEISGFSKGLRKLASVGEYSGCTDIVGTGGDMKGTINVSTAASIVCSSLGIVMGKHGNRSITGKSGGADFMERAGYNFTRNENEIRADLASKNFVFLLASFYNDAFKKFSPVRKKLGHRTIFNLMGPLTNPLNPGRIVIGCTEPQIIDIFSNVIKMQNRKGIIVMGNDGMDEISFKGKSTLSFVDNNIKRKEIEASEITEGRIDEDEVTGENKNDIFVKTLAGLNGKNESAAKFIALNAAPCLILNGISRDMNEGYKMAYRSIKNGYAIEKLNEITGGKVKEAISSVF